MPLTRSQIATKLRVNVNTLRNRLKQEGIKPSDYERVKGRKAPTYRAVFDAQAVKKIKELFKIQPVQQKRGWPKGKPRNPKEKS